MKEGKPISAEEQAKQIITIGEQTVKKMKAKGFAITYSANADQTRDTYLGYCSGKDIDIKGSNQASVIEEIHNQIRSRDFKGDKGSFRILPISTCLHAGGIGKIKKNNIIYDLSNIACYLGAQANENGEHWVIFGWKNQITGKKFAIGGGVSKLYQADDALIQDTLQYFELVNFKHEPTEGPILEIFSELKIAFELGKETGEPLAYARSFMKDSEEEAQSSDDDNSSFGVDGWDGSDLTFAQFTINYGLEPSSSSSASPLISCGILGNLDADKTTTSKEKNQDEASASNSKLGKQESYRSGLTD